MTTGGGMAAALIASSEQFATIADATIGYRRRLIEGGMPEPAADVMAVRYHEMICGVAERAMTRATEGPPT